MRTSETLAKLADALAKAQGKMKCAPLNSVNPHFKSRYADLPAIRDAVMPALTEHGLSIVQAPSLDDAGNFVLVTRLLHASGEWLESSYPLPLDASRPQVLGSALTYARRYSLSAITGIAADEDDDANEAEKQASAKPPAKPRTHGKSEPVGMNQVSSYEPLDDSEAAVGDIHEQARQLGGKKATALERMVAAIESARDVSMLAEIDVWLKGAGNAKFSELEHAMLQSLMLQKLNQLKAAA